VIPLDDQLKGAADANEPTSSSLGSEPRIAPYRHVRARARRDGEVYLGRGSGAD